MYIVVYFSVYIYAFTRYNELFILLPNKNIAVRSNLHEKNKCNLLFSNVFCVLCTVAICPK